eukprot:6052307-Amphidinium_carterae.1
MKGLAKVRNTDSRVSEISGTIRGVLDSGSLTPTLAASLVGRLSFMDGQHFARLGVASSRTLRKAAASRSREFPITSEIRKALLWSLDLMAWCPERSITLKRDSEQVVIFTDGAVEGERGLRCTMGGLAFFPRKQPEFFSAAVPSWLVDVWRSEGREHVIYQTELLPVLISICLWQESLRGQHVLVFIDNEAARCALVASYAGLEGAMRIIWRVAELTARTLVKPWFARVPSSSNPADAPSRGWAVRAKKGGSQIPTRRADTTKQNFWRLVPIALSPFYQHNETEFLEACAYCVIPF